MDTIRFHWLLSEMGAAESRYREVIRCDLSDESDKLVADSHARCAILAELAALTSARTIFPNDPFSERILKGTIDLIAEDMGTVADHSWDHREIAADLFQAISPGA